MRNLFDITSVFIGISLIAGCSLDSQDSHEELADVESTYEIALLDCDPGQHAAPLGPAAFRHRQLLRQRVREPAGYRAELKFHVRLSTS